MLRFLRKKFRRLHEKAKKTSAKRQYKLKLEKAHPLERGKIQFEERYPLCEMGYGSYGMPDVFNAHEHGCKLTIGKFCSIADGVKIILGGRHIVNWVTTSPIWILDNEIKLTHTLPKYKNSVIIENDVWIATNSLILSPVTLGNGCVVAAGSVVTKDVPPYAIVAGNPAKIVRYRFTEETIMKLLTTCWWERPCNELIRFAPLLCSDRIDELLYFLENSDSGRLIKDEPAP